MKIIVSSHTDRLSGRCIADTDIACKGFPQDFGLSLQTVACQARLHACVRKNHRSGGHLRQALPVLPARGSKAFPGLICLMERECVCQVSVRCCVLPLHVVSITGMHVTHASECRCT